MGIKDVFNRWRGKRKQTKVSKLIDAGKLPHGRTVDVVVEGTPGFGDAAIKAATQLNVKHYRNKECLGERVVHNRVVTNAGRDAIVDAFTGDFTLSSFNYHDCGTGTGNEAAADTALGTPCGTARVIGSQSQPTPDVYKSVATWTSNGNYAVTEHGIFSASSNGTLLDRTKFAAINVVSGDKIEFSFTIAFSSGG